MSPPVPYLHRLDPNNGATTRSEAHDTVILSGYNKFNDDKILPYNIHYCNSAITILNTYTQTKYVSTNIHTTKIMLESQ
jgi:hypothetical protein